MTARGTAAFLLVLIATATAHADTLRLPVAGLEVTVDDGWSYLESPDGRDLLVYGQDMGILVETAQATCALPTQQGSYPFACPDGWVCGPTPATIEIPTEGIRMCQTTPGGALLLDVLMRAGEAARLTAPALAAIAAVRAAMSTGTTTVRLPITEVDLTLPAGAWTTTTAQMPWKYGSVPVDVVHLSFEGERAIAVGRQTCDGGGGRGDWPAPIDHHEVTDFEGHFAEVLCARIRGENWIFFIRWTQNVDAGETRALARPVVLAMIAALEARRPGPRGPTGDPFVVGRVFLAGGILSVDDGDGVTTGRGGLEAYGLLGDDAAEVGFGFGFSIGSDAEAHGMIDVHVAVGAGYVAGRTGLMALGVVGVDRTGPDTPGFHDFLAYVGVQGAARTPIGARAIDLTARWTTSDVRLSGALVWPIGTGVGVEYTRYDDGGLILGYLMIGPPPAE